MIFLLWYADRRILDIVWCESAIGSLNVVQLALMISFDGQNRGVEAIGSACYTDIDMNSLVNTIDGLGQLVDCAIAG